MKSTSRFNALWPTQANLQYCATTVLCCRGILLTVISIFVTLPTDRCAAQSHICIHCQIPVVISCISCARFTDLMSNSLWPPVVAAISLKSAHTLSSSWGMVRRKFRLLSLCPWFRLIFYHCKIKRTHDVAWKINKNEYWLSKVEDQKVDVYRTAQWQRSRSHRY